jgi:hypothetical protein
MTWSAAISESKPLWGNVNCHGVGSQKQLESLHPSAAAETICSKAAVKAGPFRNVPAFCNRDTTNEAYLLTPRCGTKKQVQTISIAQSHRIMSRQRS